MIQKQESTKQVVLPKTGDKDSINRVLLGLSLFVVASSCLYIRKKKAII
ncbi:LPXTG cell wall anchor domain-containing protein [Enterococcus villorum]|nr:LPXTG cell wall anchor domain-containing protein [Enterococcus villorum]